MTAEKYTSPNSENQYIEMGQTKKQKQTKDPNQKMQIRIYVYT